MDKVPKRDMTAFYGVRRVLEVEKIFLYLSYHDGGILDVPTPRKLKGLRKTTLIRQVMEASGLPAHYASADEPTLQQPVS